MKKWKKITRLTALTLFALLFAAACGGGGGQNAGGDAPAAEGAKGTVEDPVKVGVVGDDARMWEVAKELAAKDDFHIEIVEFTDYNTPNDALAGGDLDLNAFQHQAFLDDYNEAKGTELTTIGVTYLDPLGLYSVKVLSPDEVPQGGTVAIPNDPTNAGRGIYVLEQAGLITLKEDAPLSPTVDDIAENPKELEIKELDAAQIARSLPDVDAAIINSGLAVDAGLDPLSDSIFIEEAGEAAQEYINVIVARPEDKDNEAYLKTVGYYNTDEVEIAIQEVYNGSKLAAWKLEK
ncbi:MAG: MetQ/NlpA family ABC transporter substrate-binding protein [Tissierellia bacterium]|nr:MetQ/NlpA family ABC transporter substrate-binding protein [Tissierellia bacterium]